MYRPDRAEHPAAPTLFAPDPSVMRRGRHRRRQQAAGEVAQDFVQYSLADYARRRGGSRLRWEQVRDLVEDAWLALDRMPVAAVHAR